ncbi:O-antigen polymerase [Vibrio splendidus]|uniref:O-antigen polymerase n=1 Tax=Vibrio splendidus TaxID=29497 RepID=UPI00352C0FB0
MYYSIYFLLLGISYGLTCDNFGYEGYVYEVNYPFLISSCCIVIFLDFFRRREDVIEQASDFYGILIKYLVLIPLLCYVSLAPVDYFFAFVCVCSIFLALAISNLKLKISFISFSDAYSLVFWVSLIAISLSYISVSSLGFNLDINKVYEFREAASTGSYSGIYGYLNSWSTKVFIFAVFSVLHFRGYKILANTSLLLLGLIFFGFTSHKSIMAFTFFILSLSFLDSINKFKESYIHLLFIMLLTFPLLIYYLFDDLSIFSLLVRRVIFLPQYIIFNYHEFFSSRNFVLMSNSILSAFSDYDYDVGTSKLIGGYLGKPDMGANSGFLASGYMHFGIIGVILFSSILGFLIAILSLFVRSGVNFLYVIAISMSPMLSFIISSDFGAALFTHGLLISMFILFLLSLQSRGIK